MFESFLFSLTLSRYRRAKREGMANLDLMNVLVRDGMLAFGVIFAAMVTNTVLFTLGARTVSTAGFPWLLAILGCAGSRLVLNVREVNRPHKTPSSLGDFEVTSDIYRALDQCDPDDDEADDEVLELKKKLNAPLPLEHQHAADPERRPLAV
ncbi:hypothetical protein EVJ58_g1756 [Rhodofomes roseus]|nr:hypothetical protein EVJ58_g1756 [Rhodofomes roseus]